MLIVKGGNFLPGESPCSPRRSYPLHFLSIHSELFVMRINMINEIKQSNILISIGGDDYSFTIINLFFHTL